MYTVRKPPTLITENRDINQRFKMSNRTSSNHSSGKVTTPRIKVTLAVGGTNFVTEVATLKRHPNTVLASLDKTSQFYDTQTDSYVFDRDPLAFSAILNFYRTSELHLPLGICGRAMRHELKFWKISELNISQCCWKVMYEVDKDEKVFDTLKQNLERCDDPLNAQTSWRFRLYVFLERPNSSTAAKIWNTTLMTMIFLSALTLVISTIPSLRKRLVFPQPYNDEVERYLQNSTRLKYDLHVYYYVVDWLYAFDHVLLFIFTLEVSVRIMVSFNKRRFFSSFINWVDMITSYGGWLVFALETAYKYGMIKKTEELFWMYFGFRCVMMTRLLRCIRLQERYTSLKILLITIRKSSKELLLLVLCFIILAMLFGTVEYYCEFDNNRFETIPISIWWSIVTMTTVGYGDYYPESLCGYFVGTMCAMCGILFLSMPVALIGATFNDYYTRNQERELHRKEGLDGSLMKISPKLLKSKHQCFEKKTRH
ncbi:potassium voltage-gated channel protein Shaw-like [Gigantopelta aegis]|uniref:potassium voltage-gated channel protein Shaw-like n=1 Tax=Gigantopelta aegis TaxID=1735272 RepID=UPI001B88C07A|nr:potassium voltage-gated channel protein Shaw-like [Gigantopelta aegis]